MVRSSDNDEYSYRSKDSSKRYSDTRSLSDSFLDSRRVKREEYGRSGCPDIWGDSPTSTDGWFLDVDILDASGIYESNQSEKEKDSSLKKSKKDRKRKNKRESRSSSSSTSSSETRKHKKSKKKKKHKKKKKALIAVTRMNGSKLHCLLKLVDKLQKYLTKMRVLVQPCVLLYDLMLKKWERLYFQVKALLWLHL